MNNKTKRKWEKVMWIKELDDLSDISQVRKNFNLDLGELNKKPSENERWCSRLIQDMNNQTIYKKNLLKTYLQLNYVDYLICLVIRFFKLPHVLVHTSCKTRSSDFESCRCFFANTPSKQKIKRLEHPFDQPLIPKHKYLIWRFRLSSARYINIYSIQ